VVNLYRLIRGELGRSEDAPADFHPRRGAFVIIEQLLEYRPGNLREIVGGIHLEASKEYGPMSEQFFFYKVCMAARPTRQAHVFSVWPYHQRQPLLVLKVFSGYQFSGIYPDALSLPGYEIRVEPCFEVDQVHRHTCLMNIKL